MADDYLPYMRYKVEFGINGVNFTLKRVGDSQFRLRFGYKDGESIVCMDIWYIIKQKYEIKIYREFIKWYKLI